MSKIIIIGCGGAGINIVNDILSAQIPTEAAVIQPYFVDTSDANLNVLPEEYELFKMETIKSTEDKLAGSGGERQSNVDTIKYNVKVFVDNLPSKKVGDFYVVVGSLSGGSASVIAPLLTAELLKRDLPTLVIAVGDSKSELNNTNTTNTLQTYIAMSKMAKKPISMMYFNNTSPEGDENTRIETVNKLIVKNITGFAIMVSDTNQDMDYSDMSSFLDVSKYKTIDVPDNGINILQFHSKRLSEDCKTILVSRGITSREVSMVDIASKHDKTGYLQDETLINTMGKSVPLILTSSVGLIAPILKNLDTIDSDFKKANKNLFKDVDIETSESDDDGLVF